MRWKMRDGYFKGAGSYAIAQTDTESFSVEVDTNGYFETERDCLALGVCAKRERAEDKKCR